MKVYKLVRLLKDGNCYPLFIDKQKPFRFGEYMDSEYHPTKGFAPRSINKDKPNGGWHCCFQPVAPHLNEVLKTGEQRVWIECETRGLIVTYDRPESQGGTWILSECIKPLRIVPWSEVREMQKQYKEKIA